MKKTRALLFVFVMTAAMSASESSKAIVGSYLQIQTALAADKTEGVKTAAEAIGKEAAKIGAQGEALAKAAQAIGAAKDLKAAREAFGPLSDAVIAAAKADEFKDLPGIKIGYCPMADKSWLQKEAEVRNPYYGSQMLTCGSLKDPAKK